MPEAPLVKKLSHLPICRGLSEQEVGAVFDVAEEATVARGQHLFKEGDPGDALYVVLGGHLEITKRDRNGSEQVLAKLGEGSVVGEMSLLGGDATRSASALATSDLRLLKLPANRFSKLLRQEHVAALKMVHNLAQVMSRRLFLMDEKLVDLLDKGKRKEELADFHRILTNWSF